VKPARNPSPGPPEADSADTRTRLLDAAEELFGQHGFSGASLRAITAAAGANIAAVNYHFGNRAALVQEVIARRVGPVNEERLRRLDELEAAAASGPPGTCAVAIRDIVDAFLAPALHAFQHDATTLCRIMGRVHAERSPEIRRAIFSHFEPVLHRFTAALGQARPDLPPDEIADRFKFMVGAMAFALMNPAGAPERDLARMINFVSAGLAAPATPGGEE
jgi:AcrR family transcriptional regulator